MSSTHAVQVIVRRARRPAHHVQPRAPRMPPFLLTTRALAPPERAAGAPGGSLRARRAPLRPCARRRASSPRLSRRPSRSAHAGQRRTPAPPTPPLPPAPGKKRTACSARRSLALCESVAWWARPTSQKQQPGPCGCGSLAPAPAWPAPSCTACTTTRPGTACVLEPPRARPRPRSIGECATRPTEACVARDRQREAAPHGCSWGRSGSPEVDGGTTCVFYRRARAASQLSQQRPAALTSWSPK